MGPGDGLQLHQNRHKLHKRDHFGCAILRIAPCPRAGQDWLLRISRLRPVPLGVLYRVRGTPRAACKDPRRVDRKLPAPHEAREPADAGGVRRPGPARAALPAPAPAGAPPRDSAVDGGLQRGACPAPARRRAALPPPDMRDLLLGRGYIEPPPVPFVPSAPERPDAGRPRP